jgi:hypothetical protein
LIPWVFEHQYIKALPTDAKQPQVEGEAQGEAAALEEFLKAVNRGPTFAYVINFEKKKLDVVDGEEGFEVRKTY